MKFGVRFIEPEGFRNEFMNPNSSVSYTNCLTSLRNLFVFPPEGSKFQFQNQQIQTQIYVGLFELWNLLIFVLVALLMEEVFHTQVWKISIRFCGPVLRYHMVETARKMGEHVSSEQKGQGSYEPRFKFSFMW